MTRPNTTNPLVFWLLYVAQHPNFIIVGASTQTFRLCSMLILCVTLSFLFYPTQRMGHGLHIHWISALESLVSHKPLGNVT